MLALTEVSLVSLVHQVPYLYHLIDVLANLIVHAWSEQARPVCDWWTRS